MTKDEREGVSGMWFRGLDNDKKAAMVEVLKGSVVQFDRLKEIIEQLYRASQSNVDRVDSSAWALAMAHAEGYRKALRDIYKIIPETKRKNK